MIGNYGQLANIVMGSSGVNKGGYWGYLSPPP